MTGAGFSGIFNVLYTPTTIYQWGGKTEFKAEDASTQIDLHSAPHHRFYYNNFIIGGTLPPESGVIGSMLFSTGTGGTYSLAYGFGQMYLPVAKFELDSARKEFGAILKAVFGGNDFIVSYAGHSYLNGFAGNDTITALGGNNTLVGGAGNDTFVFWPGFGHDEIKDFSHTNADRDVIEMHGMFHSLAAVKSHSHVDSHGHLVIAWDAGDTITLDTVHSKGALVAGDFHFYA
jgi:Ca2+-binding RTX toxin-like protein